MLDHALFGDLFGTEEVRRHFEPEATVQAWLDVEHALSEAQAELGLIPPEAAKRIGEEARAELYDLEVIRAGISESQHPLVPLIRLLVERCEEHGGYVHWGATTQDIVDTGAVLQARAALAPIRRDVGRARAGAAGLARRHRTTLMAGRTHGQHAVPITFGLKAASWADELDRAADRLEQAASQAMVGQLAGASGSLASLGSHGAAVREGFCRRLGLTEPNVPWHAARDRVRTLVQALAEVGTTAERISLEVVRLQATEVGEVSEPLAPGHVGSSTMPQKRNPFVSEYLVASARLLRGVASVVADSTIHANERDMSAWAVEWVSVPQAFILAGGVVDKLAAVLEGLVVDEARMLANLDLTNGLIMAEAVMMELARSIGHEEAHRVVAAVSRRAEAEARPFSDVLTEDPRVARHLTAPDLRRLLDPARYLGLCFDCVDSLSAEFDIDAEAGGDGQEERAAGLRSRGSARDAPSRSDPRDGST